MKLEDKHNDFDVTDADAFGKFVSDGVKGIYVMKDEKVLNDDGKTTDCKADNGKYNATAYVGQDKYTVIADTLGDKVNADAFKITYDGTKQTVNGTTPAKAVAKSYITKDTSFIAAEGKSDDLTVKTATGGMKMAQKDPSKVYVLVEDGKTDAVVVLYVGDDLGSVVDTTDVVYLKDDTNTKNANGYEGTLYFMKDMSSQSVTIKEDTDKGFYVYGVDDKDVYKLSAATELKAGDDTSDDGTTGYAMGVKLTVPRARRSPVPMMALPSAMWITPRPPSLIPVLRATAMPASTPAPSPPLPLWSLLSRRAAPLVRTSLSLPSCMLTRAKSPSSMLLPLRQPLRLPMAVRITVMRLT